MNPRNKFYKEGTEKTNSSNNNSTFRNTTSNSKKFNASSLLEIPRRADRNRPNNTNEIIASKKETNNAANLRNKPTSPKTTNKKSNPYHIALINSDESFKGKKIVDENLPDKLKYQNLKVVEDEEDYPCYNRVNSALSRNYTRNLDVVDLDSSEEAQEACNLLDLDLLTPLPQNKKSNNNAVNYNQAKSAAIYIRRIEYSYNLKLTAQYKRNLKQIIFLQRYWRYYLLERSKKLKLQQKLKEIAKLERIKAFKQLINVVAKIYYERRIDEYFNILKYNYAQLYFLRITTNAVKMIKDAWLAYKQRQKEKIRLAMKVRLFFDQKRLFFGRFRMLLDVLKKLILLQRYIKSFLKTNSEDFFLSCGRTYHPYLYYLSKYRDGGSKLRSINKLKDNAAVNYRDLQVKKILKFVSYVERWLLFHKKKKEEKVTFLFYVLHRISKKEFFNIFITRMIALINSEITYILLKPRIDSLMHIYFRSYTLEKFKIWKYQTRKSKMYIITGKNMIKKLMHIYYFKPAIKNIKKFIYAKNKSFAFYDILNNIRKNKLIDAMKILRQNYVDQKNKNSVLREAILKHLVYRNNMYTKFHYYYLYKQKVSSIRSNRAKYLLMLFKKQQFKSKLSIASYLFEWRKMLLKFNNFETKTIIFINSLNKILKHNSNSDAFTALRSYYNRVISTEKMSLITLNQQRKIEMNFHSKFIFWLKMSKMSTIDQAAAIIGQIYRKKIVKNTMNSKKNSLCNSLNNSSNNVVNAANSLAKSNNIYINSSNNSINDNLIYNAENSYIPNNEIKLLEDEENKSYESSNNN